MKKALFCLNILLLVGMFSHAEDQFQQRIQKIVERTEFRHALFGLHFLSLENQKAIFSMNADKYFVPASTTKLITAGSALELFGADHRFHTKIFKTGEMLADGTLNGDLILVAGGDPNLSGRVNGDKLLFENADHSYGGEESHGVPGDPLLVIRKLAKQAADRGMKRITGRVIVDATLFPQGERELGTYVVLSPIVVNDNVVDVLVMPGASENAPASIKIAPATSYVRIQNKVTSGKSGSDPDLHWESDVENSDGTRTVILAGSIPTDKPSIMFSYAVPDPARYAEVVLTEALREAGITANFRLKEDSPDFKTLAESYTESNQIAEHISPPMSEETKVMLKVSQNLHASMMPFLIVL
jgi:D-alanyl-D-alanine carboxypeptidase/D-alanyl-D-alanine-endopeptidase (penicillin-binding protein 4)